MYSEFQKTLKDALNQVVPTKVYKGELKDPKSSSFVPKKLPCIYIDFVEEQPFNDIAYEVSFHLYIVHASYSLHEKNQEKKEKKLFELIEEINEKINNKNIGNHIDVIKPKKLSKIFDAKSADAYITIYKRTISTKLIGEF